MNTSPQKFKINKKFKPCPVEDGDELFANGIFVFNVTKMLAFMDENPDLFPLTLASVKEYILTTSNLNEAYLTSDSVDVNWPVILAEIAPNQYNLIDGHHRIAKAGKLGMEHVSAFKIAAQQHISFLTTSKAYSTYIDYWNCKIVSLGRKVSV